MVNHPRDSNNWACPASKSIFSTKSSSSSSDAAFGCHYYSNSLLFSLVTLKYLSESRLHL